MNDNITKRLKKELDVISKRYEEQFDTQRKEYETRILKHIEDFDVKATAAEMEARVGRKTKIEWRSKNVQMCIFTYFR